MTQTKKMLDRLTFFIHFLSNRAFCEIESLEEAATPSSAALEAKGIVVYFVECGLTESLWEKLTENKLGFHVNHPRLDRDAHTPKVPDSLSEPVLHIRIEPNWNAS